MEGLKERKNENPATGKELTPEGNIFNKSEQMQDACPLQPSEPSRRIFVAFPHKSQAVREPLMPASAIIYCERPTIRPTHLEARNTHQGYCGTGESFSSRMVSLMVLLTTVFAAIGLLRMMITGLDLPRYTSMHYIPKSWRNGAGPSPLDAVQSDYQHALTKVIVSATDTLQVQIAEPVFEGPRIGHKKIKISANTFTSTIRGGIHNLKLKVHNGTRQFLEKVTVEVDFLQANGRVIRSERFTAMGVAPLKVQTIKVPEGMPGVRINYRLSEVRSRSGAAFLQRI